MDKLREINTNIESTEVGVNELYDEVGKLVVKNQEDLQKQKENKKYAQPLTSVQIQDLAQKGGGIVDKPDKLELISNACNAFLYDQSGEERSPFYKKISSFFSSSVIGWYTDFYLLPKLIDKFYNDNFKILIDSEILGAAITSIRRVYQNLENSVIIDFLKAFKLFDLNS